MEQLGKLSRKEAFTNWLQEKAVPVMNKVGNQRHLSSIRDGFAIITPMIIAAAVAMIILTSVFGGLGAEKASILGVFAKWDNSAFNDSAKNLTTWGKVSDEATRVLWSINQFGIGLITIYFSFGFGYFLCKSRGNSNPEIGGLVALGAFFIATIGGKSSASYIGLDKVSHSLAGDFVGANGIFAALIIVIIACEIYCYLCNLEKLKITMPAGVPPAVARSFSKLFPIIITALSIGALLAIVAIPTHLTNAGMLAVQSTTEKGVPHKEIGVVDAAPGSFYNLGDVIYMAIQAPFIYAATIDGANLGIAVLYTFLVGFFWSFGIHGTNVANGIFNAVWFVLFYQNQELLKTGGLDALRTHGTIFVQGTFDAYIFWGGAGEVLAMLVCVLTMSKKIPEREVAKFGLPAAVFNISEPIMFGFPLVANPVYMIPMWFSMPITTVTTWIFSKLFDTTPVYTLFPWTTPVGVGALFATGFDWTSFIIALINFGLAFVIWMPFVLISSHIYVSSIKKQNLASVEIENNDSVLNNSQSV